VSVKVPLLDEQGAVYALAGISTDITFRKKIEEEIQKQSVHEQIFSELSQLLASITRDYQTVLDTVVRRCAEMIGDGASIFMYDPDLPHLKLAAVYNPDHEAIDIFRAHMEKYPIRTDEGAYGYIIQTGQSILHQVVDIEKLIEMSDDERRAYYERLPLYSAMFAPLRAEGKILGVLGVGRHHADHPKYEEKDLVFLQDIADRSAMVILNAQLYAALETELAERAKVEDEIRCLNADLEARVCQRTSELEASNKELEAFAYSVSHDLRAPLRAMDGFSNILINDFKNELPPEAQQFLQRVRNSAVEMNKLIDDLLNFSRLSRQSLQRQDVPMKIIASEAIRDLIGQETERNITYTLLELPNAHADPSLMRQVWMNLLSNAIKYSSYREEAHIEIGAQSEGDETVYFVRDNGVGFDMTYVDKLFGVFQRLHSKDEFDGTGIGLANVKRIIERHGGRVWAEASIDVGATFYFTVGDGESSENNAGL